MTPIITTKGWDVQVKWIDQLTSLVPLHLIKESNPIEVAEYTFANNYHHEPAFRWWVHQVLCRCDRLIKRFQSQSCRKLRTKFGIEITQMVEEANYFI